MQLWRSLAGIITVEIISASTADMLTAINTFGIYVKDVIYINDLTVQLTILRRDYKSLKSLLDRRGEMVKILHRQGLYWTGKSLLKRPVLLLGVAMLLFLILYLPTRVLFIRVEGNTAVPTNLILNNAERCGIRFGASRSKVRSEKMKNALLAAVPQLQWAGVNTYGCVATISVKERSTAEAKEAPFVVSNIVASRDGVISEITVRRGNSVCKVGQAVKQGQILVSGYTDCGLSIQATNSDAEVYAKTLRDFSALSIAPEISRGVKIKEITLYRLRIGKKVINLSKDSGISDTTCAKIYKEEILTLPGGFQLPIAWIMERCIYYASAAPAAINTADYTWLNGFAQEYLSGQMVAGQILNADVSAEIQDNACCFTGKYACIEMIGRVQNEENWKEYGKRD